MYQSSDHIYHDNIIEAILLLMVVQKKDIREEETVSLNYIIEV